MLPFPSRPLYTPSRPPLLPSPPYTVPLCNSMGLTSRGGVSVGPSLPEDDIHDEAVPQQPPDTHGQVEPHNGDLEPKRQESAAAGVEQ